MVVNQQNNNKKGAIFLGSKGGAGHNSAREALFQRYLSEKGLTYSDSAEARRDDIIVLDMMDDILDTVKLPFIGKVGAFGVRSWDTAQQTGNVGHQEFLAFIKGAGEFLMFPFVYTHIKRVLSQLKAEPEVFISTQAFCTHAIAKAITAVNQKRGWSVKLDLWMTDMPTRWANHFFRPLRKLKKHKHIVCLHTVKPMLGSEKGPDAFWGKHTRSVPIVYEQNYPIRQAFFKQSSLLDQQTCVTLKIHPAQHQEALDERAIILAGLSEKAREEAESDKESMSLYLREQDHVMVLLLGSRPARKAVLDYLEQVKTIARQSDTRLFFFIYVGAPEQLGLAQGVLQENRLLREISATLRDLPQNLNIVPFTYQEDDVLAPLMARANVTITRSGGLTSMELLHLNNKQQRTTLIHTEKKRKKLFPVSESEHVLSNYRFISWEAGNAEFLIREIGAKIVQPASCLPVLQKGFCAK